jgi:hypothetical protein
MKGAIMNNKLDHFLKVSCDFWPEEIQACCDPLKELIVTLPIFQLALSQSRNIAGFYGHCYDNKMNHIQLRRHIFLASGMQGEGLKRITYNFSQHFPDSTLRYFHHGPLSRCEQQYRFKVFPGYPTTRRQEQEYLLDLCVLCFFGSECGNSADLDKCSLGKYLGKPISEIQGYFGEHYLRNSPMMAGIIASARGNKLEQLLKEKLQKKLPPTLSFDDKRILPKVLNSKGKPQKFDLVISSGRTRKKCAIEVAFQETTNSTIQQKANAAGPRFADTKNEGFMMAYMVGGIGFKNRQSVVKTLIENSDLVFTVGKPFDCDLERAVREIRQYFEE